MITIIIIHIPTAGLKRNVHVSQSPFIRWYTDRTDWWGALLMVFSGFGRVIRCFSLKAYPLKADCIGKNTKEAPLFVS